MKPRRILCVAAASVLLVPALTRGEEPSDVRSFRRADADADGVVNITDAVFTFNWLFLGGESPACMDATDSNDDGEVNISDGIFTLSFLFTGGEVPPYPGQERCGLDSTQDALGCKGYSPCSCGGFVGRPCEGGDFCDLQPGSCNVADMLGYCVPVPDGCPKILEPVCGCDGVTYSNDCERSRARVVKDHDGPCEKRCGGIAGIPCSNGEFCDMPPGTCEVVDNMGACVEIPAVCPDVFDPVCGCDGKTYGNDCERVVAQVSKDHDGPCEKSCGGIAGIQCGKGEFCDMPPGTCEVDDNMGTCVEIPGVCPAVFDPVCGCDGKTYGNDCERIVAQVSKDHDGPCEGQGQAPADH